MCATARGALGPSIVLRQLRKKLFPEGTFPDSVALKDDAGLRTESKDLSLERSVERPVRVRPPTGSSQRRVPGLCEVRPIGHHLLGQGHLLLRVLVAQIERLAEDKSNLVGVHRAHPLGPGGDGGLLHEVEHVDVVPGLRVPVRPVHHWAGELVVPGVLVHGVAVLHRVVGLDPVGVLVLQGGLLHLVEVGVGRRDGLCEVESAHEDVLLPREHVGEIVEHKVIPLVLVRSKQDVALFEIS